VSEGPGVRTGKFGFCDRGYDSLALADDFAPQACCPSNLQATVSVEGQDNNP
jgi:hypothetical protein